MTVTLNGELETLRIKNIAFYLYFFFLPHSIFNYYVACEGNWNLNIYE